MQKLSRNPIALAFAVIAFPLLGFGLFVNIEIGTVVQLVFAPYFYDGLDGYTQADARFLSSVLLGTQLAYMVIMLSVHKLSNVIARRILWTIGVVLVVIYFCCMIVTYMLSNGFH